MSRVDEYRAALRGLRSEAEWEHYLLAHSGLPGPRGNLELAQAVALEGSRRLFERLVRWDQARAPANTAHEFLAFCGVVGLGRLAAEGDARQLARLRGYAADPRWRTREAVAMALQSCGRADMAALLAEMQAWAIGTRYEQRAAAAALCEPALLWEPGEVAQVLRVLDHITTSIAIAPPDERKSDAFRTLRQALGYCWSVAVVALPDEGKALLEKWLRCRDPDVGWVMRENLKKARMSRMDAAWVGRWRA